MKIILSRKGFDSGTGGVASPILPSAELCSLPIPELLEGKALRRYEEIGECGRLVGDLTRGKIRPHAYVHLDPDLSHNSMHRQAGWKPAFGQAGAAESHLRKHHVGAGDIFLFYGWFREVEEVGGRYRYMKGALDLHVIFGWLQIGQRINVAQPSQIPPWVSDHPHCVGSPYSSLDALYIGADRLELPCTTVCKPGAGTFKTFSSALQLTAPGRPRSMWRLPAWFHPEGRRSTLSYHGDPARWQAEDECTILRCVGRGQEFVLDCEDYPEAMGWVGRVLSNED